MLSEHYHEEYRDITIPLKVNFEQLQIIYEYVDTMYIISKLGGYKKGAEPFLRFFYPIAILSFLMHYSKTVSNIYKAKYKSELSNLVTFYFGQLNTNNSEY